MKNKYSFILILTVFSIIVLGCTPNYKAIFLENKLEFEEKEEQFNKIIFLIHEKIKLEDIKYVDYSLKFKQFNNDFAKEIDGLGIDSIYLKKTRNCDSLYFVTFNIKNGWNKLSLNKVQFIYHPCSKYTKKGFHKYDGYHQDWLGLGDKWYMYSDTDLF